MAKGEKKKEGTFKKIFTKLFKSSKHRDDPESQVDNSSSGLSQVRSTASISRSSFIAESVSSTGLSSGTGSNNPARSSVGNYVCHHYPAYTPSEKIQGQSSNGLDTKLASDCPKAEPFRQLAPTSKSHNSLRKYNNRKKAFDRSNTQVVRNLNTEKLPAKKSVPDTKGTSESGDDYRESVNTRLELPYGLRNDPTVITPVGEKNHSSPTSKPIDNQNIRGVNEELRHSFRLPSTRTRKAHRKTFRSQSFSAKEINKGSQDALASKMSSARKTETRDRSDCDIKTMCKPFQPDAVAKLTTTKHNHVKSTTELTTLHEDTTRKLIVCQAIVNVADPAAVTSKRDHLVLTDNERHQIRNQNSQDACVSSLTVSTQDSSLRATECMMPSLINKQLVCDKNSVRNCDEMHTDCTSLSSKYTGMPAHKVPSNVTAITTTNSNGSFPSVRSIVHKLDDNFPILQQNKAKCSVDKSQDRHTTGNCRQGNSLGYPSIDHIPPKSRYTPAKQTKPETSGVSITSDENPSSGNIYPWTSVQRKKKTTEWLSAANNPVVFVEENIAASTSNNSFENSSPTEELNVDNANEKKYIAVKSVSTQSDDRCEDTTYIVEVEANKKQTELLPVQKLVSRSCQTDASANGLCRCSYESVHFEKDQIDKKSKTSNKNTKKHHKMLHSKMDDSSDDDYLLDKPIAVVLPSPRETLFDDEPVSYRPELDRAIGLSAPFAQRSQSFRHRRANPQASIAAITAYGESAGSNDLNSPERSRENTQTSGRQRQINRSAEAPNSDDESRHRTNRNRIYHVREDLIRVPGVLIIGSRRGKIVVFLSRDRPNVEGVVRFMRQRGISRHDYECDLMPQRNPPENRDAS